MIRKATDREDGAEGSPETKSMSRRTEIGSEALRTRANMYPNVLDSLDPFRVRDDPFANCGFLFQRTLRVHHDSPVLRRHFDVGECIDYRTPDPSSRPWCRGACIAGSETVSGLQSLRANGEGGFFARAWEGPVFMTRNSGLWPAILLYVASKLVFPASNKSVWPPTP